jgi:putative SOS response-associated peptidase YedK
MFRTAFSKQRCLVLCDGYYEWQRLPKGHKQPHYFCLPLGAPMILAGLYSSNERLTGNVLETFCVLTVSASSVVNRVHHRMPVILDQGGQSAWLDPARREEVALRSWLRPWEGEIEVSPVSTFVNSPANNSAQCIQPLQADSAPV